MIGNRTLSIYTGRQNYSPTSFNSALFNVVLIFEKRRTASFERKFPALQDALLFMCLSHRVQ